MKMNVGVFFGGRSVEHEVSVISANQAMAAMSEEKYQIIPIYMAKNGVMYSGEMLKEITNYKNLDELLAKCDKVVLYQDGNRVWMEKIPKPLFGGKPVAIDLAIPVVHGTNVEDGTIQGYLETLNLPYAGCDVTASALGMDKIAMKDVLQANGVPVLPCKYFYGREWFRKKEELIKEVESLGYPVIIKPANLGSSVGISIAKNQEELVSSIEDAARYAPKILVEHAITNLREINCSVLGDPAEAKASVCEEPITSDEFLSYENKYMDGAKGASKGMASTQRIIPAELPEETTEKIQEYCLKTFQALGCAGVVRIDCMIDKDNGEIYVNEINTIPGSLSFYLWEKSGISFEQLMDALVDSALKRSREKEALTFSFDTNLLALQGGVKGAKGVK